MKDNPASGEKWVVKSLLEAYAKEEGYVLSPSADSLIEGLVRRRERFGEYYCPCRLPRGDPAETEWMICPCTALREEIEANGRCHCGLFEKPGGV